MRGAHSPRSSRHRRVPATNAHIRAGGARKWAWWWSAEGPTMEPTHFLRGKMKLARIPASASLLLLAACGSDGNAALSKQFNYGSPQSPTSSEQTAISSAESTVSDTAAFNSSADATKGATIVTLADDLASAALGASGFG